MNCVLIYEICVLFFSGRVCVHRSSWKDEIVVSCLPYEYEYEDYTSKITQMVVGLSMAIALLSIELLGFVFGVSMFMTSASVLSIGCHATASVLLSYALFDAWDCSLYWWVFSICSVPPGIVEVCIAFSQLLLKRV